MFDNITNYFENFGKKLGTRIKLPNPSHRAASVTSLVSAVVGIAIMLLGYVNKKMSLVILGATLVVGNICILVKCLSGRK